jgi:rhamnulokinase
MGKNAYLAIDLGAESGRTIVGVLENERLELHETHRFRHLPCRLPTGLHWDLTEIWNNILDGVRESIRWCNAQEIELDSLGVDAWGVDWALVSQSGELLGLPHCYRDECHFRAYDEAIDTIGGTAIYEATGIQLMALNTLFQFMARHKSEPALLEKAQWLLFIPDLFHFFFTGNVVVEATIASTSSMTSARTGNWANDFLESLELPTHMLGEISPTGTVVGELLPELAKDVSAPLGLKVVAPASHDTAAAVAAVPAVANENWCYVSSGTWSLMGAELDEPCLTDAAREANFTNEGGIGGSIRFLKNIIGLWLVQECRRAFEQAGGEIAYGELTVAAADAEPFRTILDPDHEPFLKPGEMPEKIAAFARSTNQPEPTEHGQFVRACLETLALTYRRTLNRLEEVTDKHFDVLHIVGGGGKNELLNQMTADAIGRRVVVGPEEATAAGNVLTQALGQGDVRDLSHIRSIVAGSFRPKAYLPAEGSAWDVAFDRFAAICDGE